VLLAVAGAIALGSCSNLHLFDNQAPGEVSGLSLTSAGTQITLSWSDPGTDDLEAVRISWDGETADTRSISPGREEFIISGLQPMTAYTFTVRTVDAAGNVSEGVTLEGATSASYSLEASWESSFANDGLVAQSEPPSGQSASLVAGEIHAEPAVRTAGEAPSDTVIVKYRAGVRKSRALTQQIRQFGTETVLRNAAGFPLSRVRVHTSLGRTVEEVIAYYESLPEVEYAERDGYRYAFGDVDDPYFSFQWNFAQLGMSSVWNEVTGDGSVVVAVVDSGVAYDLSDFAQTGFVPGYDFVNDDPDGYDDNSHGTHVAGTIAQSTDNGTGAAGMAYGVSIMPVKALGQDGAGTISDIAAGITWAVDNGADVINLSLGGATTNQTEEDALQYAHDNGVALIAASGNENSAVGYPAAYDEYVLAVGATRYDKTRAAYSNWGPELDLVAQGGDLSVDQNGDTYGDGILQQTIAGYDADLDTTDYTSDYYFYQGTSMASPHVAALAALLLTKDGELTVEQLYTTLTDTADDLGSTGRDDYYGHGLINPAAALSQNPWFVTDARSDRLDPLDNTVDRWQLQVTGGTVEAQLEVDVTTAQLELTLLDPDGSVVAESAGSGGTEEITYDTGSTSGQYTLEIRLAP
jgi:serine protease